MLFLISVGYPSFLTSKLEVKDLKSHLNHYPLTVAQCMRGLDQDQEGLTDARKCKGSVGSE